MYKNPIFFFTPRQAQSHLTTPFAWILRHFAPNQRDVHTFTGEEEEWGGGRMTSGVGSFLPEVQLQTQEREIQLLPPLIPKQPLCHHHSQQHIKHYPRKKILNFFSPFLFATQHPKRVWEWEWALSCGRAKQWLRSRWGAMELHQCGEEGRRERERGCGVSAVMREGINCLFVSIFIRKSRVIGQRLKRFSYIFFLGRNNFAKNMNSNVEPWYVAVWGLLCSEIIYFVTFTFLLFLFKGGQSKPEITNGGVRLSVKKFSEELYFFFRSDLLLLLWFVTVVSKNWIFAGILWVFVVISERWELNGKVNLKVRTIRR